MEIDTQSPIRQNWLPHLIETAIQKRWCTRYFCTTCGANKFRSEVIKEALNHLKDLTPIETLDFQNSTELIDHNKNLFLEINEHIKEEIANAIILELRKMDKSYRLDYQTAAILFHDVETILGISNKLDEALEGTAMGSRLSSMRQHELKLASEARATEMKLEEKRREKQERRRAHELYLKNKPNSMSQQERLKKGQQPIHKFLKEFEELSSNSRLEVLASDRFTFPIDVIPKNLIPVDANVGAISDIQRQSLQSKIDRRRGRWATLKSRLEINMQGSLI